MKIVHQCMSNVGWQPIRINSSSGEGAYTVHVNPWGHLSQNICECKAYTYRGECKHQQMAQERICGWDEVTGLETQTPEYRRLAICPRCHQATQRTVDDEV